MSALLADLGHGLRLLRQSPGFALITIGTLALGIGATTAMFGVVDGVILKPFAVKDQSRLLVVWTSIPERGLDHWPLSYASYEAMRERLRTVSGVAAQPYSGAFLAVVRLDDDSAMPVQRAVVTGEWFEVLGVRARAGRLLTRADDRIGAPDVVVLSSGLAERLFGSVNDAVGRRVRIQEATFTVVGVAPAEFDYPRSAAAWMPAVSLRDSPYAAWDLVVRMAPGFTVEQTVADLTSALATLPPQTGPLGPIDRNQIIHARSFAEDVVGDVRPSLLLLGGGVLLMLAVAGVNVLAAPLARPRFQTALAACFAALALVLSLVGTYGMLSFLVRQRRREIGIRMALGAAPSNVRRLVLGRGLTLGALGVLGGVAGALAIGRLIQPLLFGVAATDPVVLAGTAAALLAGVLAATLLPTRIATRTDPLLVLRSE